MFSECKNFGHEITHAKELAPCRRPANFYARRPTQAKVVTHMCEECFRRAGRWNPTCAKIVLAGTRKLSHAGAKNVPAYVRRMSRPCGKMESSVREDCFRRVRKWSRRVCEECLGVQED